jgi:hypothetical protein
VLVYLGQHVRNEWQPGPQPCDVAGHPARTAAIAHLIHHVEIFGTPPSFSTLVPELPAAGLAPARGSGQQRTLSVSSYYGESQGRPGVHTASLSWTAHTAESRPAWPGHAALDGVG